MHNIISFDAAIGIWPDSNFGMKAKFSHGEIQPRKRRHFSWES